MTTFTARGLPIEKWPTGLKSVDQTFHLLANTSTFSSPFTRNTQTVDLAGALFDVQASYPPIDGKKLGEFRAFVAKLRGQAGRFIFPAYCCRYAPPDVLQPERVTILPFTVDTTKFSADTTEITADTTEIQMETVFTVTSSLDNVTINGFLFLNSRRYPLEIGSYISWDDPTGWRHLHIVTDMTNTSGSTTLTVEPPMRYLPISSTAMHVHSPSGIFKLADDGQGAIRKAMNKGSFTIAAMQTFPLEVTV
jgi:hypothetical protein